MLRHALLVLAGGLQVLAFAPFFVWPAAILSFLVLIPLCLHRDPESSLSGWLADRARPFRGGRLLGVRQHPRIRQTHRHRLLC